MPERDLTQPAATPAELTLTQLPLPQLCHRVLRTPGSAALLQEFRRRAADVLSALHDEELQQALTVDPPESVPDEWVAAVYEVLAEAEPCKELPADTRQSLLKLNLEEERVIGAAFRDHLLYRLPHPLGNMALVYAATPRVSNQEQRHLRQTASVDAGWPDCAGLVACGLTPLSVFYATKAIYPLANRLRQRGVLPSEGPVVLSHVRHPATGQETAKELAPYAVREVLQVARCGEKAAETLVNWLVDVARVKPLVFAEARAEPEASGVRLTADQDPTNKTLKERWREVAVSDPGLVRVAAGSPLPRV